MPSRVDSLITLADLQAFVRDGARESVSLEFKSGKMFAGLQKMAQDQRAKRRDEALIALRGDVAAMANYRGGVLVIGIDEDQYHRACALSPFSASDMDKDRLTQAMQTIRPPLRFVIHELDAPCGGLLLVAQIPPHEQGTPFHTHDGLFRIRDNSTTRLLDPQEMHRASSGFSRRDAPVFRPFRSLSGLDDIVGKPAGSFFYEMTKGFSFLRFHYDHERNWADLKIDVPDLALATEAFWEVETLRAALDINRRDLLEMADLTRPAPTLAQKWFGQRRPASVCDNLAAEMSKYLSLVGQIDSRLRAAVKKERGNPVRPPPSQQAR